MQDYYKQCIHIYLGHKMSYSIDVIQYDTAREIHFYLDDYIAPPDSEIRVYIKKPSGKEIYNHCLLADNEIIMYPTTQMFAECGTNIGQIQIVKDNKVVTSFLFEIHVYEGCAENAIPSTNEFTILDALIIEARNIIAAEASRVEAENIRIENELGRIENENSRIENEKNRDDAESFRNVSEENRINAEANRETAETNRMNAETARENAEAKRQENTSKAIADCNAAILNADNATSNANDSADKANRISTEIQKKAQDGDFSATISGVEAITGEPGTEATVENTGTIKDAKFVFTIPKGDPGMPAGFGSISANITEDGGEPEVIVDENGSNEEKNFAFTFKNIKGEKGEQGEPGKDYDFNTDAITFTESVSRENISSGETLPTIFGKIKKFFSDLKTVAFSGNYNDLLNKPSIPAAVAVKGNAEGSYRTGNVNLTPGNIGALPSGNVINNVLTTAAGYALDARMGKALNDSITALNSNLNILRNSIQIGRKDIGNVAGNSTSTVQITFSYPFSKTPRISATPYTPESYPGSFEMTITSTNSSGFVARVTNRGNSTYWAAVDWIAIDI